MTLILNPTVEALRHRTSVRFCWAFEIYRPKDGVTLRFNDSDLPLVLEDGEVYEPIGAPETDSKRLRAGVRGNDYALAGVVRSDGISVTDIKRGLFEDAEVTARKVDWRYPWEGHFGELFGFVQSISYDDERWTAQVVSMADKLNVDRGRIYGSQCRHILGKNEGDHFCQAIVLQTTGQVTASSGVGKLFPRGRFRSNITTPMSKDNLWRAGNVTWQTGLNAVNGIRKFEVFRSLDMNGEIELLLETEFDIQIGDQFLITSGCDGTRTTCNELYGRREDMDADLYNPGVDKWIKGGQ